MRFAAQLCLLSGCRQKPLLLCKSSPLLKVAALAWVMLLTQTPCSAQVQRVVVIKVDGLPNRMVDRFVRERNPRTGKSLLPWIEHVFYERGTRVANFYVRGMSLSGPSWSLLDTGQHLQIKGNVEFDRYTLHSYDYLNFIPFYLNHATQRRADMPGPEILDEVGVPLLADAYPFNERYLSFQLFQRGTRWTTLQRGLTNRFTSRSPRELFDELTVGFDARGIIFEQLERELMEKLSNPRIRYLDYYTSSFDHATHHNRDRETHLHALEEIDALIGRIWTAIEQTQLARETALLLVSDHGTNTDERIYSQGYNLVKLLGSTGGGGHHVITKRRLLLDYSVKGINPIVPLVISTTPDSYYLKKQSTDYPTALLDFDGNERAAIHLRNSDLNLLHILLQQLKRPELDPAVRRAATESLFSTLDRRRQDWHRTLTKLNEELGVLRRMIEKQRALVEAQPKEWTKADLDSGRDQVARRLYARLDLWINDERSYAEYARMLANLLSLRRESFDPLSLRIEDMIAQRTMGDHNTIHQLQNYIVGLKPGGLMLAADGSLDVTQSFVRIDYPALLRDITVRNNVQSGVTNRPVDFVALRIPSEAVRASLGDDLQADEIIWLYGGRESQALILSRKDQSGQLLLRYLPVTDLQQGQDRQGDGQVRFVRAAWQSNFPLKMWEDDHLQVPASTERAMWLNDWHTDLEWLRALHRTKYSNALIGLHEQFSRHPTEALAVDQSASSADEHVLRRFRRRQRRLVENDLLIHASDHWNFDVRGFNPGGNHGSLYRVSTHATLMLAGGEQTGIPRGLVVEEPYDSLSFVPTVLALTNQLPGGRPAPNLWEQGFRIFPGRIIQEIFKHPNDKHFAEAERADR
ncbi:MAG: alkaline phosphatase family protein [Pyrinomonadaceae bacterium]|nr:alkaline phosphatase family protein [Pyrinomonadaceae bacterium]